MLESRALPDGVHQTRTTPEFTFESVPDGLLNAHQIATDVWGRLHVRAGSVTFVDEATGDSRLLGPGNMQVIPPESPHHVEPDTDARFVIEFYR